MPRLGVHVAEAHVILNPSALAPPVGFAHAVLAGPGRTVYLGGQTAQGADGAIRGSTIVEQFDLACENVVRVLDAAGAVSDHLVQMLIYVTDLGAYRESLGELGAIYRRHFGRRYVASALFEVKGLFDPSALVELVCVAVIPSGAPERPSRPSAQR